MTAIAAGEKLAARDGWSTRWCADAADTMRNAADALRAVRDAPVRVVLEDTDEGGGLLISPPGNFAVGQRVRLVPVPNDSEVG